MEKNNGPKNIDFLCQYEDYVFLKLVPMSVERQMNLLYITINEANLSKLRGNIIVVRRKKKRRRWFNSKREIMLDKV